MEELNESIKRINERIDHIERLRNNFKEPEPTKTILALEYLRKTNPNNNYSNVFQDEVYVNLTLLDLVINGLIYDENDNILYITESNKTTEETLEKFSQFIRMDKPLPEDNRSLLAKWRFFFDEECGIINNKEKPTISTFFLDG